jgi:mono/diheme cytochrome c family protein
MTRGAGVLVAIAVASSGCGGSGQAGTTPIEDGMTIFRFDTFGDEQHWTDSLQLHTVIESTVSPMMALGVGLKVDADVLPAGLLDSADLASAATTVALLKLDAVVGLKGTVTSDASGDHLTSLGVTCALCHSTVDDRVMPGIGSRRDGWPNRDLDPGAIIALSPTLSDEQRAVYTSWGKGRYDPRYNIDGQNGPVIIPPAYGLKDSPHATYTGDGDVEYWNSYVAVTQMGGQGQFKDDRIHVDVELPAGAPDLVKPKLEALRDYQFGLAVPTPAAESFDGTAADRGRTVFATHCAGCHAGDARTLRETQDPRQVGQDPAYAARSATKQYRVTPLRALALHPPYFHDGSAATLADVVAHYENLMSLDLSDGDKADLIEFLKSI